MEVININQKFNLFNDHWSPRIVGELNDAHIKLRDYDLWLNEGEVEHCPIAEEEVDQQNERTMEAQWI